MPRATTTPETPSDRGARRPTARPQAGAGRRVVPRPDAVRRRRRRLTPDPADVLPVLGASLAASVVLALLPSAVAPPAAPAVVRTGSAPVPRPSAPTVWAAPVDGPVVVLSRFDPPTRRWLPGHRGVDLDAAVGDVVRSAGAGTVGWAGPVAGRGVVVVQHPDGRRTTYEPVDPVVAVGDVVATGDPLGRLATGAVHCGGVLSCLHWGLRRGDDYLDPMLLLRRGRPVLLP